MAPGRERAFEPRDILLAWTFVAVLVGVAVIFVASSIVSLPPDPTGSAQSAASLAGGLLVTAVLVAVHLALTVWLVIGSRRSTPAQAVGTGVLRGCSLWLIVEALGVFWLLVGLA